MKKILALLFLFLNVWAAPAWADPDPATKFGRGLSNVALGWFEIFNEIGHESDKRGPWIGFPSGLVRGTAFTVVRTLAGAYEVVTFLLPNGSKGYGPIVLPEFVFDQR